MLAWPVVPAEAAAAETCEVLEGEAERDLDALLEASRQLWCQLTAIFVVISPKFLP